jgi:hypothetical protein
VGKLDTAEEKFTALNEGVDVITDANAIHKNRLPCLKSRQQQGEGATGEALRLRARR